MRNMFVRDFVLLLAAAASMLSIWFAVDARDRSASVWALESGHSKSFEGRIMLLAEQVRLFADNLNGVEARVENDQDWELIRRDLALLSEATKRLEERTVATMRLLSSGANSVPLMNARGEEALDLSEAEKALIQKAQSGYRSVFLDSGEMMSRRLAALRMILKSPIDEDLDLGVVQEVDSILSGDLLDGKTLERLVEDIGGPKSGALVGSLAGLFGRTEDEDLLEEIIYALLEMPKGVNCTGLLNDARNSKFSNVRDAAREVLSLRSGG